MTFRRPSNSPDFTLALYSDPFSLTPFHYIYRSHDAARQLSDDGFERVREFTQRAFEMALHFVAEQENIALEDEEDEDDKDEAEDWA